MLHLSLHPLVLVTIIAKMLLNYQSQRLNGWRRTNIFLVYLLSTVQLANSVEDKYKVLAEGIFSFFCFYYGCHPRCKKIYNEPSMRPKHDRALKKVNQLRTKARSHFRQGERNGALVDNTKTLARNFFNLVRQQSKITKKSRAASVLIHQTRMEPLT